jgi:hypothetical protein
MFVRLVTSGLALLAILAASHRSVAAEPAPKSAFAVEEKADRLIITDGGKPVAEYVFNDPVVKRPYFAKVHTPSGIQVTRNHPPVEGQDLADHPTFHPGIWWGFGDINGEDFWRNKATIRHDKFLNKERFFAGEGLYIQHDCSFLDTSGTSLGKVSFRWDWYRVTPSSDAAPCYLVYGSAEFVAGDQEMRFGDQEEMGLGVRVATPLAEKNGGRVTGDGDKTGAKAIWGTNSKWCDYSGTIDGRKVGVTVIPNNLLVASNRHWWHVRDYGLLVGNNFGKRAMSDRADPVFRVPPRTAQSLSYHLLIHDAGDPQTVIDQLLAKAKWTPDRKP